MRKIIYTLTISTIIVAIIGYTLTLVFGQNVVSYLSIDYIDDIKIYKYDFYNYIRNIQASLQIEDLSLLMPGTTWQTIQDISQTWQVLINDLAYIFNWIIVGINCLLYPIRIAFYAIQIVLALIGIQINDLAIYTTNPLGWLVTLCRTMINLQIPYIVT